MMIPLCILTMAMSTFGTAPTAYIDGSCAVSVSSTLNYSPIIKQVIIDGCECCLLYVDHTYRWLSTPNILLHKYAPVKTSSLII